MNNIASSTPNRFNQATRSDRVALPGAVTERWPWILRAMLGLLAACLAVGLNATIPPLRPFSLLLAFPAVVLSTWFLGMWGGIVCGLGSIAMVHYFLTNAQLMAATGTAPQSFRLTGFFVVSILLGWAIRRLALQRAEWHAELWRQQLAMANVERQAAEERAMASEAARESEKRLGELAAIVDSSDDVILSKDLIGIITSWNAAATSLFGYSPEEMIGESILKLIPDHLHPDEEVILESFRVGKRLEHFETVRLTKDGRSIDVSLTISPIKDGQGRIVGTSTILRDVSARKRMEQSLLQAEKIAATGRMATTIAHEINNPLEGIVNLLYLLRPMVTEPDGIAYLNLAESEIDRVSHIAKQTLGYYRENAAPSRVSLAEVIKHAVQLYEPRCLSAGIEVKKSLDSSRKIVLRRGEITQVISNLIVNSIYAMPAGGILSVSVTDSAHSLPGAQAVHPDSQEDGILLTIEDNGAGIAAEHLPRVFEAFFTARSAAGTGIGLFVAKQFVEGHGGCIKIESSTDSENHGTAVHVFLPLVTSYEVPSIT